MAIRFWDKGTAPGPEAMTLEHEEILAGLRRAMLERGPVGKAAERAMRLCLAHFPDEEKFLFPAFGLLSDLSSGNVRPEMALVLPLISEFTVRRQRLQRHHEAIVDAVSALLTVAHKERNREVANLAYKVQLHERLEDEVTYPSLFLIGNYLRDRIAHLPHSDRKHFHMLAPRVLRPAFVGG